jgi:hypothetical protein
MQLAAGDACTMEEVDDAERALATAVPDALGSYFRLAGREARFNRAHNQLLQPAEWFIDAGHLVFLAENQSVVFWGIPVGDARSDPPVSQGVNRDPIEWFPEHHSCSEFLGVMAHWQAVMGGFGRTWSAIVDANFQERLDGWGRVGAVNGMHAFNRSGVALCWLRWDDDWRIFAASADDAEVECLSESLNVAWDPNYE